MVPTIYIFLLFFCQTCCEYRKQEQSDDHTLSVLIRVQTICKVYQKTTKVAASKERVKIRGYCFQKLLLVWKFSCMNNLYISHRSLYIPTYSFWAGSMFISSLLDTSWFYTVCNIVTCWVNHLCNLGRRHHEEQSCEFILNFEQLFRRKCHLKVFLIWSSGIPFVQRRVTICAILVGGIVSNNSVKLFWIWVSGSGDVFLKISYLELWQPSCSVEWNHICNLERRLHGKHSCEAIWNLDQWFRRRCYLKKKFMDRQTDRQTTDGRRIKTLWLRWAKNVEWLQMLFIG